VDCNNLSLITASRFESLSLLGDTITPTLYKAELTEPAPATVDIWKRMHDGLKPRAREILSFLGPEREALNCICDSGLLAAATWRLSFQPKPCAISTRVRAPPPFENLQVLQPRHSQRHITAAVSTSAGHDSTSADWLGPAHVRRGRCAGPPISSSGFIADEAGFPTLIQSREGRCSS